MAFWIVATLIALAATAAIVAPLLRGHDLREEASDVSLYRDQLAEIDRDLARGVLPSEEAERSRTEVARRLLAADRAGPRRLSDAPRGANVAAALITLAVVTAGGLLAYTRIGVPGYPDLPLAQRLAQSEEMRAGRPTQAEAEQAAALMPPTLPPDGFPEDYLAMVEELRTIVPGRPDDLQGWSLLAQHEAILGNYGAAARAQERVIQLKGDAATAGDWLDLVDRYVAAAGGIVSPETERILTALLGEDEGNIGALYYMGALYAQTDRPDVAFRLWRRIVETATADSPYLALVRAQIEEAAFRAGEDYALPPERGPSADDIAAAADMTEEERAAMIEGMVEGLAARLASEGGPVEDWARLIAALGQLGQTDRARAIWTEGQTVFAGSDPALATLAEAAARAGLTE